MKVSYSPSNKVGNSFPTGILGRITRFLLDFWWMLLCLGKKLSAGGVMQWGGPSPDDPPQVSHNPVPTALFSNVWETFGRCQITVKGGQSFARGQSTMMSMKQQ